MIRFLYLFLLTFSPLWSIDLDVDFIRKNLQNNPENSSERILLIKYYIQNRQYLQAESELDKLKGKEISPALLKQLSSTINKGVYLHKITGLKNLQNPFDIEKSFLLLKNKNKCKDILAGYQTMKKLSIPSTPTINLISAECYYETGNIAHCASILKNEQVLQGDDVLALQAKLDISAGRLAQAEQKLANLKKNNPSYPQIPTIEKMIRQMTQTTARQLEREVQQSASLQKLQDLVYLLNKDNRSPEAIRKVEAFVHKHPQNNEAKLLLVKLYYWNGKLDKAFHTIYPFRKQSDETKKLYANILYEKGDYRHALYYLPETVRNAHDPKEKYHLKKRLAFAYAFTGAEKKAQKLFHELLKTNSKDQEIQNFLAQRQTQQLVKKAIAYYRNKEFTKARTYFERYYQKTKDPKIAKEIAEIYYFQKQYRKSLPYFKAYLSTDPNDQTVRFHYANALEKEKKYPQAAEVFASIKQCNNPKICYLAAYHRSYNLMKTQRDRDWFKARAILRKLVDDLQHTSPRSYYDLKKYAAQLYKKSLGPVSKPTRYKDIVLTEGAKKIPDMQNVFSNVNIIHSTKPSLEELLDLTQETKQKPKPHAEIRLDYVKDSQTRYRNYQFIIHDFLTVNGIRYSVATQKYLFNFAHKHQNGDGFKLTMERKNLSFELGVRQINDNYRLIPEITWSPVVGAHSLSINLSYLNGAFINYRQCMLENETDVLHLGIYDSILLDNLQTSELALDINAYEDGNTNIYAMWMHPFFNFSTGILEHRFLFNENIDYNSKPEVCYRPASLYDSTYLIYNPKIVFAHGSLQAKFGKGYAFKSKENISTFALNGNYTLGKFATLELNCERVQSSFTSDDIDYCTFNVIQEW